MTNEELKIHLLLLKENARGIEDTIIQNVKKESFLWIIEELIKALEQQPSDDCISREDTLKEFKRVYFDNATVIRCAELILGGMPSVTPTSEDIKEAYLKGYDYGVKDWFKSKTQPSEDCIRELIREFDNKHPALFADYIREFNNHPIAEIIEYMWDMHDLLEDIEYRLPDNGGGENV